MKILENILTVKLKNGVVISVNKIRLDIDTQ